MAEVNPAAPVTLTVDGDTPLTVADVRSPAPGDDRIPETEFAQFYYNDPSSAPDPDDTYSSRPGVQFGPTAYRHPAYQKLGSIRPSSGWDGRDGRAGWWPPFNRDQSVYEALPYLLRPRVAGGRKDGRHEGTLAFSAGEDRWQYADDSATTPPMYGFAYYAPPRHGPVLTKLWKESEDFRAFFHPDFDHLPVPQIVDYIQDHDGQAEDYEMFLVPGFAQIFRWLANEYRM